MARRVMLLVLLAFAPCVADARAMRESRTSRTFLGASMQPSVVAHTLQKVVDEWKAQATFFVGCHSQDSTRANCQESTSAFEKSCKIVLGAVVQGSGGDKTTAHEYMQDVCGQPVIIGWQKRQCKALALALDNAMTADSYGNRWGLSSKTACDSMWSHILKEQEKRVADKKAAREALESKGAAETLAREKAQKEAEAQASANAAAEPTAHKRVEAEVVAKAAQKEVAEVAKTEREQAEAIISVEQIQPKVRTAPSKGIVAAAPSKIESNPALVHANVVPVEAEPAQAKATAVLLQAEMQPEVVAHTLKNVESEWRAQAVVFAGCDPKKSEAGTLVKCQDAPASFGKSCRIVVGAIVQGSSGDKTIIHEYMSSVCSQSSITGWRKKQCQDFALGLNKALTDDPYENRNNVHAQKMCDSMWIRLSQEERSRAAAEKVAREVEAKNIAEAHKFSQEEKAAARARWLAEKAAAESAQKTLDEDARQKANAQAQAQAAADLAETFAKAAKQKATEAAQAERQRKELTAKVASAPRNPAQLKVAPAPTSVVQPTRLTVSPRHVMPEPKLPHKRPPLAFRLPAAEASITTRVISVTPKLKLNTKAVTPAKAQTVPKQVHSWQRIAALISFASQQGGA